jgi:hypothetical protein
MLCRGSCGSNQGCCGVNVLKAKDRGWNAHPGALTRVASAAVAVKGLRCAPMNGQRTPALDRHPRCGCFSAMRKMSFSHVPHDQGHGTTAAIRAGGGAIGGASRLAQVRQ